MPGGLTDSLSRLRARPSALSDTTVRLCFVAAQTPTRWAPPLSVTYSMAAFLRSQKMIGVHVALRMQGTCWLYRAAPPVSGMTYLLLSYSLYSVQYWFRLRYERAGKHELAPSPSCLGLAARVSPENRA